jgi:hypothetical protein
LQLVNNFKTSGLELGLSNIFENPCPKLHTHQVINHTQEILALPGEALFDGLGDLMLDPQRHVNIDPILEPSSFIHGNIIIILLLNHPLLHLRLEPYESGVVCFSLLEVYLLLGDVGHLLLDHGGHIG